MIIIQRLVWINATNPKGIEISKTNGKELNWSKWEMSSIANSRQ